MNKYFYIIALGCMLTIGCKDNPSQMIKIVETAAGQKPMVEIAVDNKAKEGITIKLNEDQRLQTISGIGGAMTQSTAHLLTKLSEGKRQEVLEAYFGDNGSRYSAVRTHINSCDFSTEHYAYVMDSLDTELKSFDISRDKKDVIPMLLQAKAISSEGFKILASPWTAPPWMKDNRQWVGGKLLEEHHSTWAKYFGKYIKAYGAEGLDVWGVTVENEPLGNGNNWESMHFTPEEMTHFVDKSLGPQLKSDGLGHIVILGYDQNRAELPEWVDAMYDEGKGSEFFGGTAVHWYESTTEVFGDQLDYAHKKAPNKYLMQTEACIDAEVPHWQDDDWYWSKEATDWGWDWAPEDKKYLHPKYVPVYRYARDIIGCFNHHVDGWIDWNMVLDKQGGPNWFKNWCIAPVIVDTDTDEVYYTPLYYIMSHFSKYIRPGDQIISHTCNDQDIMVTAAVDSSNQKTIIIFNPTTDQKSYTIEHNGTPIHAAISPRAIQTITIPN